MKENPVPEIDINVPINAPIEESTGYETKVSPKNKFLYILGIIALLGIVLLTGIILVFYLRG